MDDRFLIGDRRTSKRRPGAPGWFYGRHRAGGRQDHPPPVPRLRPKGRENLPPSVTKRGLVSPSRRCDCSNAPLRHHPKTMDNSHQRVDGDFIRNSVFTGIQTTGSPLFTKVPTGESRLKKRGPFLKNLLPGKAEGRFGFFGGGIQGKAESLAVRDYFLKSIEGRHISFGHSICGFNFN